MACQWRGLVVSLVPDSTMNWATRSKLSFKCTPSSSIPTKLGSHATALLKQHSKLDVTNLRIEAEFVTRNLYL